MFKSILKLAIFFLFFILILACLPFFSVKEKYPSDFMGAIVEKHKLIKSINKPKLIFAGGSNLAFGIDSEILENEYKVPIVNLGLHAGLGLNFILEELKHTIITGDIVVLSIEYYLPLEGQYSLLKNTSTYFPESNDYFKKDYYLELGYYVDLKQKELRSIFKKDKSNKNLVYTRKSFNKYGDAIGHLLEPSPNNLGDRSIMTEKKWTGIEQINAFYNFAKTKNVQVYYLFPNFPKTEYDNNNTVIASFQRDVQKNIKVEVLGKSEDFVYSDSLFFDTIYHLNAQGRRLRTIDLIKIINESSLLLKIKAIKDY